MKKKLMSVLLAVAMVASMAVGCGSDKKTSSDSGDTKKTESTEKKKESNQILFNGSSTLAPVITSIATDFFDTYGTWDAYDSSLPKRKTLQSMYQQEDPDREPKRLSMEPQHLVWSQEV